MLKELYLFPALILMLTVSSCSLYEEVEMLGVENYSFEKSDSSILANIEFKINNPNFYSIKLKKSDFKVFLGEDELGLATMVDDLKIDKKTEKVYTLGLLLEENALKDKLVPLMKRALFKKTITFRIKGQAQAKVWGVLGKKFDINESKEVNISELLSSFNL